jgi:hypothetical protein
MLNTYKIVKFPGVGLMLTRHWQYGEQIWSRVRLTKRHSGDHCAQCSEPVGAMAYRPITNRSNRMMRICTRHEPVIDFPW